MSPPAWAYQFDVFDPPPDEELVCSICRSIFCDPVRSPCNHVYCKNCIYKWLETNRNCPICRKRTSRFDIHEVVPLIKNMIMKLTLKCHNMERGCEEKFPLEGCEAHLQECIYEVIRCKNRPCKEMVLRRDLQDHELRDCSHRCIPCKTCRLKISPAVPQKHDCIKELRKRIKCSVKIIKTKQQKIKDLQKEIQTLKENAASTSLDIDEDDLFDFGGNLDYGASESDISLTSSSSDSFVTDSDPDDDLWIPSTGDILLGLEQSLTQRDARFPEEYRDPEDSIEVLRSSSPQQLETIPPDDLTFGLTRRPPKRRLPIRVADSSSDDASSEVFPSPKRAWSHLYSRTLLDNLASVPETVAGPSSVATTSAVTNSSYFNVRPSVSPRENEMSVTAGVTPTTRSSGGTFERTIALLSQYNLESDPEWLPQEAENDSDSSLENPLPSRDGYITSSDESSLVESDSDVSSFPPPKTLSLFDEVVFSSEDDSGDSSWMNNE